MNIRFNCRHALVMGALVVALPVAGLADSQGRKASEVLDDLNITIGGQLRLRPEVDARDFNSDSQADSATSSRMRLSVGVAPTSDVRAYIELQDVRVFGEELNTLTDSDADGFDLHQGYIVVDDVFGSGLQLQAGRQEVNFGEQRLIGAVGWTQNARSLDGALLHANVGNVGWVKGFVFTLDEEDAVAAGGNLKQLNPNVDEGRNDDMWLAGVHSSFTFAGSHTMEPHAYFLKDGETDLNMVTFGLYAHGEFPVGGDNAIVYNLTIDDQIGKVDNTLNDKDIQAYLFAGHVGFKCGQYLATVGYEYLSGDDDSSDGDIESFNTLLATNHKFYGHMDYFLSSANTKDLGLQDIVVKLRFPVIDGVNGGADFHHFMTAEDDPSRLNGDDDLGQEIDLWVTHKYNKYLGLRGGYSAFIPGQAMSNRFASASDPHRASTSHWAYLIADFKF